MVICVVVEVWLSNKDMEPACSNASWEDSQHNWGTSEMARQPMTERDKQLSSTEENGKPFDIERCVINTNKPWVEKISRWVSNVCLEPQSQVQMRGDSGQAALHMNSSRPWATGCTDAGVYLFREEYCFS